MDFATAFAIGDHHGRRVQTDSPYAFRAARTSDIVRINDLFFREYGESYPYPVSVFDPDGIYVVGVHRETEKVIGFARARENSAHNGVYDLGGLIVTPEHRTRDVAKQLTMLRILEIQQRGGKVMLSEPVCYREDCASQHNLIKYRFVLLGIQPGKYPNIQCGILGSQPESVLVAARWLGEDSGFGDRKIFLPESYRNVPNLFVPRHVHSRLWRTEMSGPMPDPVFHEGMVVCEKPGSQFVDIPANWHEAAVVIKDFREQGYRFSCVLPGFGQTQEGEPFDYVRLYRFPHNVAQDFDFRLVHVAPQLRPLKYFLAGEHACCS